MTDSEAEAITATSLKRWLYRYLSRDASWNESDVALIRADGYSATAAGAYQRLADFVLDLGDDDTHLVQLAAAYPDSWTLGDLPSGENLRMRCFEYVDHGDAARFMAEFTQLEVMQLRRDRQQGPR